MYQPPLPLGRTRLFTWERDVPDFTPAEAAMLAREAGLDHEAWAAQYMADHWHEAITPEEADAICIEIAYSMWWAERELSEAVSREEAELDAHWRREEEADYHRPPPPPPRWLREVRHAMDTYYL